MTFTGGEAKKVSIWYLLELCHIVKKDILCVLFLRYFAHDYKSLILSTLIYVADSYQLQGQQDQKEYAFSHLFLADRVPTEYTK